MEDRLKKDVEALIKAIFSEKEEATMKQKTEEALQTSANTIDELTVALEASKTKLADTEAKVTELTGTVEASKAELEAVQTEKDAMVSELDSTKAELDKMRKDVATEVRMAELESAGVARKDRESQAKHVREMSDEEFVSYKDELVSVREAIMLEVEAAKAAKAAEEDDAAAAAKAEKEAKSAKTGEEAHAADDDADDVPPANIDPGKAVSAAMNLEVFPSDDMASEYSKLGQAMAEMFKTNK